MSKRKIPDYSHIQRFPKDPDLRVFASKDGHPIHVGYRRRIKNPETGLWSEEKTYIGRIVDGTYYTREEYDELFKRGGVPRLNPKSEEKKLRAEVTARKHKSVSSGNVKPQAESSTELTSPADSGNTAETYDERYVGIGPIVWYILQKLGIYDDLMNSFKNVHLVHSLISLLIYQIDQGSLVAKRFDHWANSYFLPGTGLNKDEVGEALYQIGLNRQARHDFFEARAKKLPKAAKLSYDSTTATWTTKNAGVARKGHSKEGGSEQQIHIGVLYSKATRSVLDVNIFDGKASDQDNFKELLERNKHRFASDSSILAGIVDRGYCKKDNIHAAVASGHKYLFAMKFGSNWLDSCIRDALPRLGLPQAGLPGGRGIKGVMLEHLLDGRSQIYVQVFRDTIKSAEQESKLIDEIYNVVEAERNHGILNDKHKAILAQYCSKKSPSDDWEIEWDRVNTDIVKMGLFCNVTTWKCSAQESYETYGDRSNVEKCFEIGKNDLSVDVIRAHTDEGCSARVFIGALAMTVLGHIDWVLSAEYANSMNLGTPARKRRLSLSERGVSKADLIEEFKSLRVVREKDGSLRYTEMTDRMEKLARVFGKTILSTPPEYCRSNFTRQQMASWMLAKDAASSEDVATN